MKYVDEYRDERLAGHWRDRLAAVTTRPWTLMEVCGGQTHAIVKFGLQGLLPPGITLVHGPGCPVCVTAVEQIDRALEIAARPEVTFCSFGDMLRVPGSPPADGQGGRRDLLAVKSSGADVRVVYSPTDALELAKRLPGREVVFFAVGFETTAPANAMAVYQAARAGVSNFSMLVSQVLVPPAIESIMESPNSRVNGFLAAGHVCTVMGYREYRGLAERYRVPIVVTGFEPADILEGVYLAVAQLEAGRCEVENQYARVVREEGNAHAIAMIREVFEVVPRKWRGIGAIERSGLALSAAYRAFDAEVRFGVTGHTTEEPSECHSGLVLQGLLPPQECPAFGTTCTPEHPLGATMVSSEGACAAYYEYSAPPASSESSSGTA